MNNELAKRKSAFLSALSTPFQYVDLPLERPRDNNLLRRVDSAIRNDYAVTYSFDPPAVFLDGHKIPCSSGLVQEIQRIPETKEQG